jgi:hypothetical protein
MRVTFYSAVVLVAAGSVVLGLDWMSAPMPPMPQAKNVVFVPPPPPAAPRVAAAPVAATSPDPSPPVNPTPTAPVVAPIAAPAIVPVAPPRVVAIARPKCDVDACARAYRSFQESDCTYNPSFGPRRLCAKGDPEKYAREHPESSVAPAATSPAPAAPVAAQTSEPGSVMVPEPGTAPATPAAPPRCNVSACAAAYPRSFREADCTFNPGSGSRRVCEK